MTRNPVFPVLFLCVLLMAGVAFADDPAILLVFDSSGSMWGKVDQTTKIEAARKVLTEVVEKIPAEIRVGMMAYGHRRKGDCKDIELVYPLGQVDRDRFQSTLKSLVPKGKTPITDALKSAAETLQPSSGPVSIILISDGVETCGGDPCELAAALHAARADLIIHVVGFGIAGEAVDQLKCVAENGGGIFFEAKNTGELTDSLTALRNNILEKKPVPAPPVQPTADTTATSKRIRISGPGTVRLSLPEWSRHPDAWYLADPETGEEKARSTTDQVQIQAGTYQAGWRHSEHGAEDMLLTEVVTVVSKTVTELPIRTGLRITLPAGMKAPDKWALLDADNRPAVTFRGTIDPVPVPAGTWRLRWQQGEHTHPPLMLGPVTVMAGELTDLVLDTGIVIGRPDWQFPKNQNDESRMILEDASGATYTIQAPREVQLLSPGDYTLYWDHTEHGHEPVFWQKVHISAHSLVKVGISSGITFLAGDQKPPYRIVAENLESGEKAVMSQLWGPMPLPPGRYRLLLQSEEHGGGPSVIAEEISIGADELIEIEM